METERTVLPEGPLIWVRVKQRLTQQQRSEIAEILHDAEPKCRFIVTDEDYFLTPLATDRAYGVWITDAAIWLRDRDGMIFQTPCRGAAVAQALYVDLGTRHEVREFGPDGTPLPTTESQ